MAKEKNTENTVVETQTTPTAEALQVKENELNQRESELSKREAALQERENQVQQVQEELQAIEKQLREKEAELTVRENALLAPKQTQVVEPQKGLEFSFRENKYKFSDDAPKTILFEGEARTQESLSQDEDALVTLIGGNSSLIERL